MEEAESSHSTEYFRRGEVEGQGPPAAQSVLGEKSQVAEGAESSNSPEISGEER